MAIETPPISFDIKFGSFDLSLEEEINILKQEKEKLVKTLIERENILQQEKDKYMADMTNYLHKTNLKYQEQYQALEVTNISISNELTQFKTNYSELEKTHNTSQIQIKELKNTI
jgi:hypothetical protein